MNNKGFTFVEILAVIVLIGILSSIAIVGVSRYRENAKNKDYEALAKASYSAMEEYMMKNPYKKEVSLETLANEQFLSNRTDPATKNTDCSGAVMVETKEKGTNGVMDKDEYKVHLCCTNYKKTYTYPEGKVDELEDEDYCDFAETEEDDPDIPTPGPGPGPSSTTVKVTLNNNGATTAGTASVNVQVGDTKLPSITLPKKTVTITYVNNGATVTGGDQSKSYTLNGWYTAASNGNKVASSATQPVLQKSVSGYTNSSNKWIKESDTTLYAHWDPVTATLPTVTKSGHTCKWTTDNGSSERASGGSWTFTSANSRTFTAVCTPKIYVITLNNNGATTSGTKTVYLKYNTGWYSNSGATAKIAKITIPITKAKDSYSVGYKFKGYYTKDNKLNASNVSGTQIIDEKGNFVSNKITFTTSDATLYARWVYQGWNLTNNKKPVLSQKWEYYNEGVKIQSGMHNLCSSNKACGNGYPHYFQNGIAVTGWKKISGHVYYFRNTDLDNNGYRDLRAQCGGGLKIDNKWAYFDSNCYCKKGTFKDAYGEYYNYQYCGGY